MSSIDNATPEEFDAAFAEIIAGFGDSLPDIAAEERRAAEDRAGRRIAGALFCSASIPPEFVDFTIERWSGHLGMPKEDLERAVGRALIAEAVRLRTATYES